jgi:hypothetical protein
MKVAKYLLVINGITLAINGMIVWLTVIKTFPPALGILLFLAGLAGAVWFSCYVNGALPRRRHQPGFYSPPTERMKSL